MFDCFCKATEKILFWLLENLLKFFFFEKIEKQIELFVFEIFFSVALHIDVQQQQQQQMQQQVLIWCTFKLATGC